MSGRPDPRRDVSVHDVRTIRLDRKVIAFLNGTLEMRPSPNGGFLLDFESRFDRVIGSGTIEVETVDDRTYLAHGFDPGPSKRRHRLANDSRKHGWRSDAAISRRAPVATTRSRPA